MSLTPTQADELKFWAVQLTEHCIFIYLGLQPGPPVSHWQALKNPLLTDNRVSTSTQLSDAALRQAFEISPRVQQLKDTALQLIQSWTLIDTELSQGLLPGNVWQVIEATATLKREVIALLAAGHWIGWLYQGLVEHILKELEYLMARLENTISPEEEVVFWTEIAAEHTTLAAHLLDVNGHPDQRELVLSVLDKAEKGYQLLEVDQELVQFVNLTEAYEYHREIGGFIADTWAKFQQSQIKSIIHPALMAHVVRETERGLLRLEQLGQEVLPEQRETMGRLRGLLN